MVSKNNTFHRSTNKFVPKPNDTNQSYSSIFLNPKVNFAHVLQIKSTLMDLNRIYLW